MSPHFRPGKLRLDKYAAAQGKGLWGESDLWGGEFRFEFVQFETWGVVGCQGGVFRA